MPIDEEKKAQIEATITRVMTNFLKNFTLS